MRRCPTLRVGSQDGSVFLKIRPSFMISVGLHQRTIFASCAPCLAASLASTREESGKVWVRRSALGHRRSFDGADRRLLSTAKRTSTPAVKPGARPVRRCQLLGEPAPGAGSAKGQKPNFFAVLLTQYDLAQSYENSNLRPGVGYCEGRRLRDANKFSSRKSRLY